MAPTGDRDLEDLRAAACWEPGLDLPPLSDKERDFVHRRLDGLTTERVQRRDAHRERLRRTGHYLGREVAGHRVTLQDAEQRLERLARTPDPDDLTPTYLISYREGIQLARAAFLSGFGGKPA
jgi:hypothetical protein